MNHASQQTSEIALPASETCRRARLARDPRFDGEFFTAVKTTGIYCRPVCPARPPAEKNVEYFASAALAAEAGYRPCLRCRPESAPNSPAWQGTTTTVKRALRLIEEGALNTQSLPQLAQRLGVGERYLRKLFQRELGVAPSALALNQRLLFAKQLLAETDLPVTEVAYAAGFGSVRRFNSAVREHFNLPPGALRRHSGSHSAGVRLCLHYRPPYDWEGVAAFFSRHAIDGIEEASAHEYRRKFSLGGTHGHLEIRPLANKNALQLDIALEDQRLLMPAVSRVRRMFDLDANPAAIAQTLAKDAELAPLLQHCPGIRAPGYWSPWEASVRAIVGQQVSTAAARGTLARLADACGDGFPQPRALAQLDDAHYPMPRRRRDTLRALCALFEDADAMVAAADIEALKGVGPWTVAMIAIRGEGQPDHFPLSDLGLVKAWDALTTRADIKSRSSTWSPWRSYAANLLWRSLGP